MHGATIKIIKLRKYTVGQNPVFFKFKVANTYHFALQFQPGQNKCTSDNTAISKPVDG